MAVTLVGFELTSFVHGYVTDYNRYLGIQFPKMVLKQNSCDSI